VRVFTRHFSFIGVLLRSHELLPRTTTSSRPPCLALGYPGRFWREGNRSSSSDIKVQNFDANSRDVTLASLLHGRGHMALVQFLLFFGCPPAIEFKKPAPQETPPSSLGHLTRNPLTFSGQVLLHGAHSVGVVTVVAILAAAFPGCHLPGTPICLMGKASRVTRTDAMPLGGSVRDELPQMSLKRHTPADSPSIAVLMMDPPLSVGFLDRRPLKQKHIKGLAPGQRAPPRQPFGWTFIIPTRSARLTLRGLSVGRQARLVLGGYRGGLRRQSVGRLRRCNPPCYE